MYCSNAIFWRFESSPFAVCEIFRYVEYRFPLSSSSVFNFCVSSIIRLFILILAVKLFFCSVTSSNEFSVSSLSAFNFSISVFSALPMFSLSIFILSLQALNLLSYSLISSRISDIFSISLTNISRVFSSSMPYFCIAFSSFSSCFFIRSFSVLAKGSFSFITALALSMTLTHSL